ncbi:MAG: cobalamin biosynthesis protein CobD [Burkholderiales bacterium]|nr:MAG: cobalamin biosynthesis protein CobD [Burkholderiales bacterium]
MTPELFLQTSAGLTCVALLIESVAGYPGWLFAAIRHPVVWLGTLITALDKALNRTEWSALVRRGMGVVTALIVAGAAVAIAYAVSLALPDTLAGKAVEAVLMSTLLAQRSLASHVSAVGRPLKSGNIGTARVQLAKIVGRDVSVLDEAGISRAATESLAENFSDGVIAPAFWGTVFGLPGIAAYKAINTLDSMIGHRTPRHEMFGWASARLDDIANLIPARLTALLLSMAALARAPSAVAATLRDARRHRSPNAGWPEAAMAGALGVRLSGPRIYHDRVADEPWLNGGARDPVAGDIPRALRLYAIAACVFMAVLAVFGWALANVR